MQGQHVKVAEESKPAGQRGEMLRIPAAEAAAGRGGSGPGQGWQGETRYDARPQVTFTRAGSGEGRERPTTAGCEIKRERETRSLCQRHRHRVRCATPTVEEMCGNTGQKGERPVPPDGPHFISADHAVKATYLWVNNVIVSCARRAAWAVCCWLTQGTSGNGSGLLI